MSRFERFSMVAFVVICACLAFLLNAVLSPASPLRVEAQLAEAQGVDLDVLLENNHDFIPGESEGYTFEEYLNNLEYYKQEIYNTFKGSREVVSFIYYDIITGYTFSYNEDVEFPSASSIKANLAIYIMDLVSQGRADLSKRLTYTEAFYNPGSGRIKDCPPGTEYTIDQLLERMMIDSDNVAYTMLLHEFGYKNVQQYWYDLNAETTYKRGAPWGSLSARDGLIYMRRLYSFFREAGEYGEKLMGLFKRSNFRYVFSAAKDIEVAHKSGNTTASMNDLAIVFDDQPFILIVLTRKDAFDTSHMDFFSQASMQVHAFHEYYWNNISYSYIQ